jgi:hypothetical protein
MGQNARVLEFSQKAGRNQDPSESTIRSAGFFMHHSQEELGLKIELIVPSHNSESRPFGASSFPFQNCRM